MNPNTLAEDLTSTLLNVDAKPVSLHLPVGSALFAYSGEVWITQEGMHEDVILRPGERFDVGSRAAIVASATTKQAATVYVACARDVTDVDLHSLLHRRARRLRAEEFNRTMKILGGRLSHALATVFAHVRAMLASPRRIPVANS